MIGSNPTIEKISEYIRRNDCYDIYFIVVSYYTLDYTISEAIGMNYSEYIKILKKHGAKKDKNDGQYFFRKRSQIENAVKELEPYLILLKLRG